MSKLISVVTVCYNAASTIEATILSVINQTYSNIEYIIIDGGSTDATVDVIKRYDRDITYWISEADKGIYDAMNKGIAKSSGDWVHFLNAGDVYLNAEVLMNLMKCFYEKGVNADILYGEIICKFNFGRLLLKPADLSNFRSYFPISHPATFVKGEVLRKEGFNTTYRIAGDYELLYRLYRNGYVFEYISIPLVLFDAVTGVSSIHPILIYRENSRIQSRTYGILYFGGFVVLRLRFLMSLIFNMLHINKLFKAKFQKKRLLRNSRFCEVKEM